MKTNVDQIAARFVLGLIPSEELPAIATQVLVDGFDGSALCELAGETNPTLSDATGQFEKALDEIHASKLSPKEAVFVLAKIYSKQILDGSLKPYEGAKIIWRDLSYVIRPDDHTLDSFVYWADEFENADDFQRRIYCHAAIFESARKFIDEYKNRPTPKLSRTNDSVVIPE
jgi:hypothetical protein